MIQYIIETVFGLITGFFLGITGIPATGIAILGLDYFGVNDYKSILGAILFLNLFPISIGSVWEFYKADKIDFTMSVILLIATIIGSYIGSKIVVSGKNQLSVKTVKYITASVSLVISMLFFISAHYERK
jgi:uncharacterized membrane protein YfcA